jgi:hypothetical protein
VDGSNKGYGMTRRECALKYIRDRTGEFQYYFRDETICLFYRDGHENNGFHDKMRELRRALAVYMEVGMVWFTSEEVWLANKEFWQFHIK